MSSIRKHLDDRAAQRIAAIGALIESNIDGEALAAARKLVAALDRHGGLRIADVILAALAVPAERGERWWQATARECLAGEPWPGCWPERTRDFLDTMTRWRRAPSPAQREWLENCADLMRSARAAS